jgi:uncharacterized protein YndB with AHSA1/START domain
MADDKQITHKGRTIRAEIRTSASPQQVWEAWADPEKIAAWFVDHATGEGKAGSIVTWFFDDFGFAQPFKVEDSVPGKLFVLKWDPPQGDPGILEIQIEREGGSTLVRLINSGFKEGAEWDEEYEGVNSGWQMSLSNLKHYLENYFGRRKSALLIFRPASVQYDRLLSNFLDPARLSRWLTKSGAIGKVGDRCDLVLQYGGSLTGRVLAVTQREVTLSWDEIGGTLELKGFSMGPQRVVGVRCLTWKLDREAAARLKPDLEKAVSRLAALFPVAASSAAPDSRT